MDQSHKWQIAKSAGSKRPDLSRNTLIYFALCAASITVFAFVFGRNGRPGDPLPQGSAFLGSMVLCVPLAFFIAKRSGFSASPPRWFVSHVLFGFLGICLIAIHVASVSGWSFALVPLMALVVLVAQGFWVRAFLSRRLSYLFARAPRSFDYGKPLETDKAAIAEIIRTKEGLLAQLDPLEEEATFSPRLRHWIRTPLKSLRYERLAHKEAVLVGAKSRAGLVLSYSRRFHMALALIFYTSLIAHVVVMLCFAGYAAKGGEVYWWHIADWGR